MQIELPYSYGGCFSYQPALGAERFKHSFANRASNLLIAAGQSADQLIPGSETNSYVLLLESDYSSRSGRLERNFSIRSAARQEPSCA